MHKTHYRMMQFEHESKDGWWRLTDRAASGKHFVLSVDEMEALVRFHELVVDRADNSTPADTNWVAEQWKTDDNGDLVSECEQFYWFANCVRTGDGYIVLNHPTRAQFRMFEMLIRGV